MARGRMISKSLSTSEKYALLGEQGGELAEFCQLLYVLVLPHTDDFGRLQGDPFTIKHMCYPASPRRLDEFVSALTILADAKLLEWYEIRGKRYLQVANFEAHQQGLHKRTRSACPPPPSGTPGNPPELPAQEKRREAKGRELKTPRTPPTRGRRPRPGLQVAGFNCEHDPQCRTRGACIALTLGRKAG